MRWYIVLTMRITIVILVGAVFATAAPSAAAFDASLRGEASAWGRGWELEDAQDLSWSAGARYIPMLTILLGESGDRLVDLDAAGNLFAAAQSEETAEDWDAELYRLKLRFATPRTETRIGLQKITFGPAQLLRSLRWFDRLDPRDPQQLTEGVWALLLRLTARDNSSLRLWGIYPDGGTKGFESFSSEEGVPEGGARYQRPLLTGEAALSFHTRQVEVPGAGSAEFRENRFGLDGRWDVEIGLWFETVFQHQDHDLIPFPWSRMLTVGADYTIGAGNGLYLVAEHLAIQISETAFGSAADDRHASAWMMSYPLSLLDSISAVGVYSWDEGEYSQYVSFQRTWDHWILNLSVFRYPETSGLRDLTGAGSAQAGTGGQVLLIFNH